MSEQTSGGTAQGGQGGQEEYDVVVIGGGPVGENAAQYAIEGTDLTAAIVEGELLGGECSYWACMPSKALLRPVQVAGTTADLGGVGETTLDVAGTLARRDEFTSHYDDAGQVSWAEGAGLTVVRGTGRLAGERVVDVSEVGGGAVTRRLLARRAVVLATGSEPVVPQEYADVVPWGSRDVTGVVDVPGRLAVVGGGVVACEAATWMSALGAQVTQLVRGDRLLGSSEPFAGEAVQARLEESGVTVHLGTTVSACTREGAQDTGIGHVHGGPVTLTTTKGRSSPTRSSSRPAGAHASTSAWTASASPVTTSPGAGCRTGCSPSATSAARRR